MNRMRNRMLVFFAIFLTLLVAVIGRIIYWQVFRAPELKTRGESQQMSRTNVNANRGTIYDRNGKPLAESASVNTVICNPQQIKDDNAAEVVSKYLSDILGLEYDDVYNRSNQ